jgi:hypothetical protein
MNSNRIGTKTIDGVVFPEFDLFGGHYRRPTTTLKLDETRFVVLPDSSDWEQVASALAALRAELEPKPKAKRKRDDPPTDTVGLPTTEGGGDDSP